MEGVADALFKPGSVGLPDFPYAGGREDGDLLPSDGCRMGARVSVGKEVGGKDGEGVEAARTTVKGVPY